MQNYLIVVTLHIPNKIEHRNSNTTMIGNDIDKNSVRSLAQLIERCNTVVITCHVKPDGDAVGSTLALMHILSTLGKAVHIVTPDSPPRSLRFLPGCKEVVAVSSQEDFCRSLVEKAELIFCLDFNALNRIDRLAPFIARAKAKKVLIDHHLDPEAFADITISRPSESSTCALLFKVICALGLRPIIDKKTAMCFMTGIMTDTGNLSYNANDPDLYTIVSDLLRLGVNKVRLWERLNIKTQSQLRLNAFAIDSRMELLMNGRAALITLNADDLARYDYVKGDTEGLVNVPLTIPEVAVSVFMHQEPGFIKVSMRSKGEFPVNKICSSHFGGGGHLNAAGGEFRGHMREAVDTLRKVLPDYAQYLPIVEK